MLPKEPILFFDETCPFCRSCVAFFLKLNKKRAFYVAPLTGTTAQQYLTWVLPQYLKINTIILLECEQGIMKTFIRTRAILKAFQLLGGIWHLTRICYILPLPIWDMLYRVIAKVRRYLPAGTSSQETIRRHTSQVLP